jgi:hypothetical protein
MESPQIKMNEHREPSVTRREAIRSASVLAGATLLVGVLAPEKSFAQTKTKSDTGGSNSNEEYVWLSANANLPLFVAHDHPALRLIGETLAVKVTIAGPNRVDIRGLVEAGETLHFWWFDPRTGTNVDLGTFPRAWRFEITAPLVGENVDWILVCDDAAKGYPAPGFGEIGVQADYGRISPQAKALG